MRKALFLIILLIAVFTCNGAWSSQVFSVDPSQYGDNWSIETAGDTPYLVQNGIPAFGRFTTDRPRIDLDGAWKFALDKNAQHPPVDDGWEPIEVPGVWNYLRPDLLSYVGAAWYMKTFDVPSEWKDRRMITLHFGGVNMRCRIWVNGVEIGGHEGGYTPFAFDVTDKLEFGTTNTIMLLVDNRMTYDSVPPLNYDSSRMGWWEYGGIHREVYLEAHAPVTAFRLVVQTSPRANDKWAVWATVLFLDKREKPGPEGASAEGIIEDENTGSAIELRPAKIFAGPNGVWGITFIGDIQNPRLWSPVSPDVGYLFHVNVTYDVPGGGVESEYAQTPFGVRKFEARSDGLFLNGKPYYIRGLNRHEDDPETGLTETPYIMLRDIQLLKEMNINHIRTAHYPSDPRFFDLTDREGIGITEEIPLYQAGVGFGSWFRDKSRHQKPGELRLKRGGPEQFNRPQLIKNAKLQLIEMITRDINHPSILAWSIGNENWTFSKSARKPYIALKHVAKTFDPDRAVTFALLTVSGISESMESTADIADFISINEYFGWYFGKVEQLKGFLVKMHKRYPYQPIVVSEFGAEGNMELSKIRAERQDGQGSFDPEDQARLIAAQWATLRSLPFVWGGMPWVFADFRCGWFKDEAPKPFFNTKGVVTFEREPKAAFYVLRDIYADLIKNPPSALK